MFRSPYARPQQLSDPFHDYDGYASDMLNKSDAQLECSDFYNILNGYMPAGIYKESVYFLPLALEFMAVNPLSALDCEEDIIAWIAKNMEQLRNDSLEGPAKDGLTACLYAWTSHYDVMHYEPTAWKRMGWDANVHDIQPYCHTLVIFIKSLTEHIELSSTAIAYTEGVASVKSRPVNSAWFLDYSYNIRRCPLYKPNSKEILAVINSRTLLRDHADIIINTLYTAAPTYWDNVFDVLNLQ